MALPPVLTEFVAVEDGPNGDTVRVAFKDASGRLFGIELSNSILPAVATALVSSRTPDNFRPAVGTNVKFQPLQAYAFRSLIQEDGQPALGFQTREGSEIVLVVAHKLLPQIRAEIAKLEQATAPPPAGDKTN